MLRGTASSAGNEAGRRVKFVDENDQSYVNSGLFDDPCQESLMSQGMKDSRTARNNNRISFASPSPAKAILRNHSLLNSASSVNSTNGAYFGDIGGSSSSGPPSSIRGGRVSTPRFAAGVGAGRRFEDEDERGEEKYPMGADYDDDGEGGAPSPFNQHSTSRSSSNAGSTPAVRGRGAATSASTNFNTAANAASTSASSGARMGVTPGSGKSTRSGPFGSSAGPPLSSLLGSAGPGVGGSAHKGNSSGNNVSFGDLSGISTVSSAVPGMGAATSGAGVSASASASSTASGGVSSTGNRSSHGRFSVGAESDISSEDGGGLYYNSNISLSMGNSASATTTPLATPNVNATHRSPISANSSNNSSSNGSEYEHWIAIFGCVGIAHAEDPTAELIATKFSTYGNILDRCVLPSPSAGMNVSAKQLYLRFANATIARSAADGENCCCMDLPRPRRSGRRGGEGSGGDVTVILNCAQLTALKAKNMGIELTQQAHKQGRFVPTLLAGHGREVEDEDEDDAAQMNSKNNSGSDYDSSSSSIFGPIGLKSRLNAAAGDYSKNGVAAGADDDELHSVSHNNINSNNGGGYRKVLSFRDAEDIMLASTSAKIAAASNRINSSKSSNSSRRHSNNDSSGGKKKSICNQLMEYFFSF